MGGSGDILFSRVLYWSIMNRYGLLTGSALISLTVHSERWCASGFNYDNGGTDRATTTRRHLPER